MSLRLLVKRLRYVGLAAFLWFAVPTVSWAQQFGTPTCGAPGGSCGSGALGRPCPPCYKYTYEGAPHIHWHCGCPHPICDPCTLPHYGYFEPCIVPWPFPANLTHCPTPPPASFINLQPNFDPKMFPPRVPGMMPTPGIVPAPGTAPINPPMPNGGLYELEAPRRLENPR